jgi:hypothetical protein
VAESFYLLKILLDLRIMMKLLGNKKKSIKESSKVDKAVQCDNNDPYVRVLILEKLPKFTNPSDGNFDHYLQHLQQVMKALKIDDKDKVSFLFACLQDKASEKLEQSQLLINENSSWEQTTTLLKNTFGQLKTTGNIQTLRQTKQQHDQEFHDFTNLVQQLVNKIFVHELGYTDAQRESETIRYAIRGAKKELKDQLKGKKYNTIVEVKLKAHDLETKMANHGTMI